MTLLVLACTAGVAWLLLAYPKRLASGTGREVRLALRQGMSVTEVAEELERTGVIEQPSLWLLYVRLLGADKRLRTGVIMLTDRLTPQEVTRRVVTGVGQGVVRVTVPEGFSRYEIAERLETWGVCAADAFRAVTEDAALLEREAITGSSFEGYLFPDTYELKQDTPAEEVMMKMVRNWRRRVIPIFEANADGFSRLHRELGWGLHEVMILASIVEKEAVHYDEQPIIAGVFLNRMLDPEFRPRRLQADPTVAYGCRVAPFGTPSCFGFDGGAPTRAMIADDANRYNTYRIEGLPPGAISNPGDSAIRAVLAPAPHAYLYFVARGGGRHYFSVTLNEHNEAVGRLRQRERAARHN